MPEKLIKKWWFYVILVLITFVPALTKKPFQSQLTSILITEVLQNPLIYKIPVLFPVSKILVLAVLTGALIFKNTFGKIFPLFFAVLFLAISIFQSASFETQFGNAFLPGNFIVQLVVVLSWIHEIFRQKNNYEKISFSWWRKICLFLGIFAFWMPMDNGFMGFRAIDMIANEAALTYCMLTPFILSFLFLYFPNINKVTLRTMSAVGIIFGLFNMLTWFGMNPEYWWMGVLHLPLLVNSIVGVVISKKITEQA